MTNINDYNEVRDCTYKDEYYSVRDNGAIMRHSRKGVRKRKLDEVWTFGTRNVISGYMEFCGERVHRIVATAFHGGDHGAEYVVDHIDTNRQNNRPENLRWFTRLENILNNEITRKKVEMICGSIEAFLDNPLLLYGYETEDKNFSWMRNVTKEEADKCLANWKHWAKTAAPNPNYKRAEHNVGNWIFQKAPAFDKEKTSKWNIFSENLENKDLDHSHFPSKKRYDIDWSYLDALRPENIDKDYDKPVSQALKYEEKFSTYASITPEREPIKVQSLTSNAVQINWKNPVEFPCCPQQDTDNPLKAYMDNMKKGKIFSTNDMGDSTIIDFGMRQSDILWVMCNVRIGFNTHAITKITYEDNIFYHENMGVYDIGDEPEIIFSDLLNGQI